MKYAASILALASAAQAVDSVVFSTAAIGDGDWGLTGAQVTVDNHCATAAGGNINFIGLISFDGVNMVDRVTMMSAGVKNQDGTSIAASFNDLFSGVPTSTQIKQFNGALLFDSVWTGSTVSGAESTTCRPNGDPQQASWSSNVGGANADVGAFANPNSATNAISSGNLNCNIPAGVYCYEAIPVSSGNLDPHFYGFNGEKIDIEHDETSAERAFSLFCTADMEVNTLFSSTVDGLLFMTKFWVRLGDAQVHVALNKEPVIFSGEYERNFVPALNRTRMAFENGASVEYDAQSTHFSFKSMKFHVNTGLLAGDKYLNVDIISTDFARFPAGGLVGRTMTRRVPAEEFAEYKQYELDVAETYFNQKCTM